MVDSAGNITTVAGTAGYCAFGGDGGPATAAFLSYPSGVAADSLGNLFIADAANNRIRMVSSDGVISTAAGTGAGSFSGDGGLATAAALNYPARVATDGLGNLYIADSNNNRIREVSPNGIITTVAGGGSPASGVGDGGPATAALLSGPWGIFADPNKNLFIADVYNDRIRQCLPFGSTVKWASAPGGLDKCRGL